MTTRSIGRSISDLVGDLLVDRDLGPNVVARRDLPATSARTAEWPAAIGSALRTILAQRGFGRPYVHQAAATGLALAGTDVVVVTPTASGKTLCYNVPVLQTLLDDPGARALYLFPTKALAADQLEELRRWWPPETGDGPVRPFTYDGDTPGDARQAVRRRANLVITNPDMLHAGVLPHHTKWASFFQGLRFLVIDEVHTYRGVFGSHVACVLRRLLRVAAFHGSIPTIVASSATIANAAELCGRLFDRPFAVVDDDGAPRTKRTMIVYNPPVVDSQLGIRASYLGQAERLARHFLDHGHQTIVFGPSRVSVEVLTRYLQEAYPPRPGRPESIRGYRGGYLPNTRREIEAGLRDGTTRGVVSTNALELGIDIGSLSAAILAGYPGTIASTWQQAGRAGRRSEAAVAILVCRSNPLDQYLAEDPDYLLERSPESALVNPENLMILVAHVQCAAFELPFERGERLGAIDVDEILDYLAEAGTLHAVGDRFHWMQDVYPAQEVSLRNAPAENFVVVDTGDGNRILAQVDHAAAHVTIYPGAIYLAEGVPYKVHRLEWDDRRALVERSDSDHYTDAVTYTHVKILDEFESRPTGPEGVVVVEEGEVEVTEKAIGFKKIRYHTGENVGYGDIQLPENQMATMAFWFTIPETLLDALGRPRFEVVDGLLGLLYSIHHVAALLSMSEVRDLGRAIGDRSSEWFVHADRGTRGIYRTAAGVTGPLADPAGLARFEPTLFLFDRVAGGVGLSPELFARHEELLARTADLVAGCACAGGCPACVGPAGQGAGADDEGSPKRIAAAVLEVLTGERRRP